MCMVVCNGHCSPPSTSSSVSSDSIAFVLIDLGLLVGRAVAALVRYVIWPVLTALTVLTVRLVVAGGAAAVAGFEAARRHRARRRAARLLVELTATAASGPLRVDAFLGEPVQRALDRRPASPEADLSDLLGFDRGARVVISDDV
jgi:hypothetical protein